MTARSSNHLRGQMTRQKWRCGGFLSWWCHKIEKVSWRSKSGLQERPGRGSRRTKYTITQKNSYSNTTASQDNQPHDLTSCVGLHQSDGSTSRQLFSHSVSAAERPVKWFFRWGHETFLSSFLRSSTCSREVLPGGRWASGGRRGWCWSPRWFCWAWFRMLFTAWWPPSPTLLLPAPFNWLRPLSACWQRSCWSSECFICLSHIFLDFERLHLEY